jgi:hypothetical protein
MVALAQQCDLPALADEHLRLPTHKCANAGAKVTSLVAGMVAGADSIDDMALLRHGAMGTLFDRPYAPSTLGSFMREFSFGHVRQLDAVATRLLTGLCDRTPLVAGIDGPVLVDIDDTIIEVHGPGKQGSGYGYSGVRGDRRRTAWRCLFSSAVPAEWRRVLQGWPGLRTRELFELASRITRKGEPDSFDFSYGDYDTGVVARHPYDDDDDDDGVWLGDIGAVRSLPDGVDAVVSLCQVGNATCPLTPSRSMSVSSISRASTTTLTSCCCQSFERAGPGAEALGAPRRTRLTRSAPLLRRPTAS